MTTALLLLTPSFARQLYWNAIDRLRARLGDFALIMTTVDEDEDGRTFSHQGNVDLDSFVDIMISSHYARRDPECGCVGDGEENIWCPHDERLPSAQVSFEMAERVSEIDAIKTVKDVASWLHESYDPSGYVHVLSVLTPKQHVKRNAEARRKELEQVAGSLANKYNCKLDSFAFIRHLKREVKQIERQREQWNNPEVRMEEYAAHMYAGSRDAYFDDLNFENDRYSERSRTLTDVLAWLGENCPLLMAQYRERQIKMRKHKKK